MRSIVILCVCCTFLSGCAPYRVQTDFDRAASFRDFHSYTWTRDIQRRRPDKFRFREGSLSERRVMEAVNRELQDRELKQMPPSKADLMVDYKVVVTEQLVVDHYPGWRRPYWRGHATVHRYREGTLIVEILRKSDRQLIWRGWAAGVFGNRAPTEEQINAAIRDILADFPPGYAAANY